LRYFQDPEIYFNNFGVPVHNQIGWIVVTTITFYCLFSLEDLEILKEKNRNPSTTTLTTKLDALPVLYYMYSSIIYSLASQFPIVYRMFVLFLNLPITLLALDKLWSSKIHVSNNNNFTANNDVNIKDKNS